MYEDIYIQIYIYKRVTRNDFLTLVMLDLTHVLMWTDLQAISGEFFRKKNVFSDVEYNAVKLMLCALLVRQSGFWL